MNLGCRQAAQFIGYVAPSNKQHFGNRASNYQLSQYRGGGQGRRASAGLDLCWRQNPILNLYAQPDTVLAHLVDNIADSRGIIELADVSRIRNMIGYLVVVHGGVVQGDAKSGSGPYEVG